MNHLKNGYVSLVLAGYIVLLTYLLISGTISKYINPRLSFLTVITICIMVGMLFFSINEWRKKKSGHQHHHHCNCGGRHTETLEKSSLILLLPVLLAFLIPPITLSYQPMNLDATIREPAKNKQAPDSETLIISSPENNTLSEEYMEYTQSAIGNIIFINDESAKQKLLNAKISLQGMVLHWNNLKRNEVIVYRIMINCCAADGMPLGILVRLPNDLNFSDGDWIRVEGSIQLHPFTDEIKKIEPVAVTVPLSSQYPYFTATNAYKMDIPNQPYLFP